MLKECVCMLWLLKMYQARSDHLLACACVINVVLANNSGEAHQN